MKALKIPMVYQEWEKFGLPIEGKSIMSSLTLIEGELLELVEKKKAVYLGEALEKLNWPDPLILMSVGGLVREKLIIAERRGRRIMLIPESAKDKI